MTLNFFFKMINLAQVLLKNAMKAYVAFEWSYPAFIHTVSVAIKAKLQ